MIIGSEKKLNVGDISNYIIDDNLKHHPNQIFKVIRIATFEEWYQRIIDDGIKITEKDLNEASQPGNYFYEISTD